MRISRVGWRGVLLIYCIGGGGQAAEDIQGRMEGSIIDLLYRRRRAGCLGYPGEDVEYY